MPYWARTILITASDDALGTAVEGHLQRLRELHARARLVFAGRLSHGDGFLDVFEAEDRIDAEAVARNTPLVEEGLATWMIREWEPVDLGPG